MRCFTSEAGPDSTTRLVLLAMAAKMDEDGTRCTVGARRLATMTALNKNTAALHRLHAIESGWLWPPSQAKGARCVEWLPSVPATIELPEPKTPAVSSVAGHSSGNRVSRLSTSSVQFHGTECPAALDKPASYQPYNQPGAGAPLEQRRLRLLSIIRDPQNRERYRTPDDMARAIPPDVRFRGYEHEIESAWEASV